MATRLVLELRHTVQLADIGQRIEHPGKLGVGRHVRLHENRALFRVYPAGYVKCGKLQGVGAKRGGNLLHRNGVHVHHAEKTVEILLKPHPVPQRSEIIAYSYLTARLNTAENNFFGALLAHLTVLSKQCKYFEFLA